LYDELCHASIRDGIQMSNAKAYKFQHNNLEDLEKQIIKLQPTTNNQLLISSQKPFFYGW
jgi:8-amino-7-oxononanoate synthase